MKLGLCGILVAALSVTASAADLARPRVPARGPTNPEEWRLLKDYEKKLYSEARRRLSAGDDIGFRVLVRKQYTIPMTEPLWLLLREQIFQNADRVGFNLLTLWDVARPKLAKVTPKSDHPADAQLRAGDQALFARSFEKAFQSYQEAARTLKTSYAQSRRRGERAIFEIQLAQIHHSMARALFGARRYRDALETYAWIPARYPRYRQVLFERMWTAFKGGYIDQALGAIASQRSAYFARFLSPESYLVQVYIYKKLCRESEFQQVLKEIEEFRKRLADGRFGWEEWARAEVDTKVLANLATVPKGGLDESRLREVNQIRGALEGAFKPYRERTLAQLMKIEAYANLAANIVAEGGLRKIEKMPSRSALRRLDLEIWPADSSEDWIDEIGSHRFVGESQCVARK